MTTNAQFELAQIDEATYEMKLEDWALTIWRDESLAAGHWFVCGAYEPLYTPETPPMTWDAALAFAREQLLNA